MQPNALLLRQNFIIRKKWVLQIISGPVLTLALDGAEKSKMHLRAAISAGSCGGGDP
jgi:hypothetical protein